MKRFITTGTGLLLTLAVFGQADSPTKGGIPAGYEHRDDTEHFVLLWNSGTTATEEIEEARRHAEEAFEKISDVLGRERMPKVKLIVTFGGDGIDPETRRKRVPHVDRYGRIHLYRFEAGGYLSALPHEMIHAIRINTLSRWERFFEEGLASAVAYYLYPDRVGFPRFGYALDVIAGYWLASGKGVPMQVMRAQHNRLNLKCQLQTYVLRESFFYQLIARYGMKKLIAYAYDDAVGSLELYTEIWGKPFDRLVTEWEESLMEKYKTREENEEIISSYFEKTAARFMKVCEEGPDY